MTENLLFAGYNHSSTNSLFVPNYNPPNPDDLKKLDSFLKSMGTFCILTGAGISTESGIPDYRSKGVGLYATSKSRPTLYQDFRNKEYIRRKYWARNYVGWPKLVKNHLTTQSFNKSEFFIIKLQFLDSQTFSPISYIRLLNT